MAEEKIYKMMLKYNRNVDDAYLRSKEACKGFRDFTLKSAKSGLSVGEKASFWMYGKIWALSRKWFTHFFLFAVVAAYSLLGGFLFMEIEGGAEKEAYEDIVALRRNLVIHIKNLYEESRHEPNDLMWQGRSTKAIIEYEIKLLEHFKQDSHILSKGDKPTWDFWSSVFFCGTIFTTIGLAFPDRNDLPTTWRSNVKN